MPSLMRPLTVPTGMPSCLAISLWLSPAKKASSIARN